MTSVRTASRRSFERTLASAKRTMVLSEIVSLAIDSFRTNKVRVMLTSLGMVIGSASLILVVTVGMTGKQYILHLIEAIGTNMVEIEYSGGGPGSTAQHDFRNDYLTREDETAVDEQVPSVAYSSPMLQMHDRISFGNGVVKDILVLGVSPQYRQVRNLILIAGRFFDEEDNATHAKVAVVTEPFATAKVRQPPPPSINPSRSAAYRSPSSVPSKKQLILLDKPKSPIRPSSFPTRSRATLLGRMMSSIFSFPSATLAMWSWPPSRSCG